MAGRKQSTASGRELADNVRHIAQGLGLSVQMEVRVGRRLWGAERRIDLVLADQTTRRMLGVECKFQGGVGSAEEKIPATVADIAAWPIPGIVVIDGKGFSAHMRQYLISTGKAVELHDLRDWLSLYFALPFGMPVQEKAP